MSRQLALGAFQRTKEPGKRAAGDSDACFWPKSHILKVRGSKFDLKTLICTELIRSLPRIDIFENRLWSFALNFEPIQTSAYLNFTLSFASRNSPRLL